MISPFWIAERRPPASDSRRGAEAVQARLEHRVPAAALLGRVHGDVGALDQRLDAGAVRGVAGHADAGVDLERQALDRERLAQPGQQLAGDDVGVAGAAQREAAARRTRRRRGGRPCRPRRASARSRRATSSSSRSPAWWPSVSLISLKWSRSISITAEAMSARRPAPIACSMRSRKSVRLGSPVSASCSDWCSLAIAARPPRCTARNGSSSSEQRGQRELGGQHDDGREAEQQAGGRGLEEEVVGQVAPELDDALGERDDGRDQRAVDHEEDDGDQRGPGSGPSGANGSAPARGTSVSVDEHERARRRPRSRTGRR